MERNYLRKSEAMTTQIYIDEDPTYKSVVLEPAPIIHSQFWNHPVLDLFPAPVVEVIAQKAMLFTTPSCFGENYDPDFAPQPTSASELPELHTWTLKFVVSVLEIWAGKRQPAQLSHWCHQKIYNELIRNVGSQKEVGRVRALHQSEPLDGICESTVTVRYGGRLRSLVIRFEGIDKRWLCTALTLL